MASLQAFPSLLLPRAPLAFLSRLKLPFPKLPFPSISNACHAGYKFAGHLELETGLSFTFYELKPAFSNISSEKLMLYFRLVVALYTYTQC